MNIEQLRSLQKRIRDATGPDRELDWDIAKALDASFSAPPYLTDAPEFTLDPDGLGPCVALLEAVLPGAELEISTLHGIAFVRLPLNAQDGPERARRNDGNKCLALCDAILSALIAQEEAKERA